MRHSDTLARSVGSGRTASCGSHLADVGVSPLCAAGDAGPPLAAWDQVRVGSVEGVAVFAVGLASIRSSFAIPTHEVDVPRDRFEMSRIYAFSALAQVVELHSCWDVSDEQRVGEAVGVEQLVAEAEPAVAVRAGARPYPARVSDLDKRPEAAKVGSVVCVHAPDYTMTAGA